jgi:hypothetical protein
VSAAEDSANDIELSKQDVRLLRIVLQGKPNLLFSSNLHVLLRIVSISRQKKKKKELNEQAKQFAAFCVENQKWHEQHHTNIRTIMEATQFFASSIHNKLGVTELNLKLQQDATLFLHNNQSTANKENAFVHKATGKRGGSDAHSRIMAARFNAGALDAQLRELDEAQFGELRPESAEVLLAHVGKFVGSASDEEFLLGALTLQELARSFGDIFVLARNNAHVHMALRALDSSIDRVRSINTPLFGAAEAKALSTFLRDAL